MSRLQQPHGWPNGHVASMSHQAHLTVPLTISFPHEDWNNDLVKLGSYLFSYRARQCDVLSTSGICCCSTAVAVNNLVEAYAGRAVYPKLI